MAAPFTHRALRLERLECRQLLTHAADFLSSVSDAEGEAETMVVFRLDTTDLSGVPISATDVGSEFYLTAWVRDQRPPSAYSGVFSAYLDLLYDSQKVSVVQVEGHSFGFDIQFGPEYENGMSGNAAVAGLIDEVGGFQTDTAPLGSSEVLLFRVRFTTVGDVQLVDDYFDGIPEDSGELTLDVLANDQVPFGTAEFTGDHADIRPLHSVILFSSSGSAVPDEAVEFIPAQLDIAAGGVLTIDDVGTPSGGGMVRISDDGMTLVYEPAPNFFGTETFTYSVAGREAEVTMVVDPVEDAPIANDDIYATALDATLLIDASDGLLANDYDPDSAALSAAVVQPPAMGTVSLQPDGGFEYVPEAGFRGRDTFTYVASDGLLPSEEVTVRIDVGTPTASIRLELVDDAGQVVERVTSDAPLMLRGWVEDLRDMYYPEHGVHAAYLDVLFDAEYLQPVIDLAEPLGFVIDFSSAFGETGTGDVLTDGTVNEVGSLAAGPDPLGTAEVLLFEMPLEIVHPLVADDSWDVSYQSTWNRFNVLDNDRDLVWNTEIVAESADESPDHDVLMHGSTVPVGEDRTVYQGVSIELANSAELTIVGTSATEAGGIASVSASGQDLLYQPPVGFLGTDRFTYTVADGLGRTAEAEVVVEVVRSWQNVHSRFDVNSDALFSPLDVLEVIRDLNANGGRLLVEPANGPPFVDVNGDGLAAPSDALDVIRFLNGSYGAEGEWGAEGEVGPDADQEAAGRGDVQLGVRLADALSATASPVFGPAAFDESLLLSTDLLPARFSIDSPALSELVAELDDVAVLDQVYRYWDRLRFPSCSTDALEELFEFLAMDD